MKNKATFYLPVFILMIIISITSGGCKSDVIKEDIGTIIDAKLDSIISDTEVSTSSNPYDYIKDNEDYEYIVKQGDKALNYLLQRFEETNENGLEEYIMAAICVEILGENQENQTWRSGREWYENYISEDEGVDIKGRMVDVYITALDSFMPLDEGLNGGMKYIAIDTSSLEHLSESNKAELLKYFEKYDVEVKDASFDELKEQGLFNEDTLSLEGILLKIENFEILSKKKIKIEGSKYRSGLGAIGVNCVLEHKGDEWQVKSAEITWIS